jgi:uncharacterized protein (DUF983 family)
MSRWEPWSLTGLCPECGIQDLHSEPAVRVVACHHCGHLFFDQLFWREGNPYE